MPIPIALCGKSATMASNFMSSISDKSEYRITHVCHDLDSALSELPALFRGESVQPSSDLSVAPSSESKQPIPRAVVIGKGFSEDEMKQIVKRGQEAGGTGSKTAWFLPDDDKFTLAQKARAFATAGISLPTVIAERAIESLRENGVVDGRETVGGIYGF